MIVAPEFLAVREPAVVTIGDGDQFDAGNLQRDPGVSLTLAAGTDQGELDVVVGRGCAKVLQLARRVGGCALRWWRGWRF